MKKMTMGLLVCWLVLQSMAAEKLDWLTDLPTALSKAKAENKLVLMDFTGSDWCIYCVKIDKEIFNTAEFSAYAKKNLVLVQLDFPQKTPQKEALKNANKILGDKYNKDGEFPTIIVLDGEQKTVGKLQYDEGGPKPFIAKLEKLKK